MCSSWLASLEPHRGKHLFLILVPFLSSPFPYQTLFIYFYSSFTVHLFFFLSSFSLPSIDIVKLPVWVVPGTIRFPRQTDSNVIMIGPGTGCAPFRAYIEERIQQNEKGTPSLLFCACRLWSHGYMVTWAYGYMGIWLHGHMQTCKDDNSCVNCLFANFIILFFCVKGISFSLAVDQRMLTFSFVRSGSHC